MALDMCRIILNEDQQMQDIEYLVGEEYVPILGDVGKRREKRLLAGINKAEENYTNVLPIFLGWGCGFAIEEYCKKGKKCVVIDCENLHELTQKYLTINTEGIYFIQAREEKEYAVELDAILKQEEYPYCVPVIHPFHVRYTKEQYEIYLSTKQSIVSRDIYSMKQYKRFRGEPSVLCIWGNTFITQEIEKTLQKEGIIFDIIYLKKEVDGTVYLSTILEKITLMKPDCILTINNMCLDTSGFLAELLSKIQIPFITWYFDSPNPEIEKHPQLISKYTTVFSYNKDDIEYLNSIGFEHAYYLPNATDVERFTSYATIPTKFLPYKNIIGFVGSTHTELLALSKAVTYTPLLVSEVENIAQIFLNSHNIIVQESIKEYSQECYRDFCTLEPLTAKQYVQYVVDLATQKKRCQDIINASIVPIAVAGDNGWKILLKGKTNIRYVGEVEYSQVQYFYAQCEMVLNSTCTQMKNAVNQRVFDCPSSGAFVLTEDVEQLHELFEVGKEIIAYKSTEELQEQIRYYHTHSTERMKIVQAGRKRIEQEHTWRHRIRTLVETVKKIYT